MLRHVGVSRNTGYAMLQAPTILVQSLGIPRVQKGLLETPYYMNTQSSIPDATKEDPKGATTVLESV